jgi:hypothetical protein
MARTLGLSEKKSCLATGKSMDPLLTPSQVAELLQDIGDAASAGIGRPWGAFTPAASNVLRFRLSSIEGVCSSRGGGLLGVVVQRPGQDKDPGRHGL